jgi:hypothetical protein
MVCIDVVSVFVLDFRLESLENLLCIATLRRADPTSPRLRNIRLVDRTLQQRLLIELLVKVPEVELQPHSSRDGDNRADHHEDESKLVARVVRLPEKVGRNDISDLPENIA